MAPSINPTSRMLRLLALAPAIASCSFLRMGSELRKVRERLDGLERLAASSGALAILNTGLIPNEYRVIITYSQPEALPSVACAWATIYLPYLKVLLPDVGAREDFAKAMGNYLAELPSLSGPFSTRLRASGNAELLTNLADALERMGKSRNATPEALDITIANAELIVPGYLESLVGVSTRESPLQLGFIVRGNEVQLSSLSLEYIDVVPPAKTRGMLDMRGSLRAIWKALGDEQIRHPRQFRIQLNSEPFRLGSVEEIILGQTFEIPVSQDLMASIGGKLVPSTPRPEPFTLRLHLENRGGDGVTWRGQVYHGEVALADLYAFPVE